MMSLQQGVRSAGRVTIALALALGLFGRPGMAVRHAAPVVADSLASVGDLPLTTVEASRGPLLAVILTGDGGWAQGDRSLAAAFARRDVAVVGLNSPRYLAHGRTAEAASADLARILRHFLTAWHRERVVLVGYSRGADIGPFMVSRLPADLRDRIALAALLGPGPSASFKFSLFDILRAHTASGGLPVSSEVAKLRGTPVLCIYGSRDKGAICPSLDRAGLARAVVRNGGHAVRGDEGPALVDLILSALPVSDHKGAEVDPRL